MRANTHRPLLLCHILAAALAAGVSIASSPTAAESIGGLSSPMIDRSIFRTGEVRRLTGRFGAWTAVCDEVKAIGRRYCSLRSAEADDARGHRLYMEISTGDDGRPAALLHLPFAISLAPGVNVGRGAGARKVQKQPRPSNDLSAVPVAVCSSSECLAIWTPTSADIATLMRDAPLVISFCSPSAEPLEFRASMADGRCQVRNALRIDGNGFRQAVYASLK